MLQSMKPYYLKSMFIVFALLIIMMPACKNAQNSDVKEIEVFTKKYVSFENNNDAFPLVQNQQAATIIIDANDHKGLMRIVEYFQKDIQRVASVEPKIIMNNIPDDKNLIIIGTIGKSTLIDQLVAENKIDVSDIEGNWENSLIQVVDNPFEGVDRALVIAGSDKRGTFYGVFDVSRRIGVSPWYWWADVPVEKNENIFIKNGRYNLGSPKVKYRGIFLNDEEPALGRWAVENYGGFNHQFYEKVFELMLRLKGNYMWPAMWWASFNTDDPLNRELADEMSIVMGTSHHEPMDKAHAEWKAYDNKGPWNYETNADELKQFWREGIERIGEREVIVNMAMRGDGDEAMGEDTNIELLEKIVADQRTIIEEVTGKPASETPQMWALYKEVQDYFDHGMRVPDDVTLLLCDDNWGNIRMLPDPDAPERSGGYGIYYHFDFVGGPRNYKWINVSPVQRVWEQMNLAYQHGVKQLWLVNVGDLKPMELPISFFLDFAWNPEDIPVEKIDTYTPLWAAEQFGNQNATEAAYILDMYTKYNGRRTPEMLDASTYSITNFREYENVTNDYVVLAKKAEDLYNQMNDEYKPAFYQLAYHPTRACANLYQMYYAHALNQLYASQGRASTNQMADQVKQYFDKDAELTEYFHTELMDGKWNHMMAQVRIGYTIWQQPERNIMPGVSRIELPKEAKMGIAVEQSYVSWPTDKQIEAQLPSFDSFNDQKFYVEVFNRGKNSFNVELQPSADWVNISSKKAKIKLQERFEVSINWNNAVEGLNQTEIVITSDNGEKEKVKVCAVKYSDTINVAGYIERNGYVSIDASKYTEAVNTDYAQWKLIPGMGRTGSSITTFPVTVSVDRPDENTPMLAYDFYLLDKPADGNITVNVYVAPTMNFKRNEGLHFAVSVDDGEPQLVNIHENTEVPDYEYPNWFNRAVGEKVMIRSAQIPLENEGQHSLKIWMVDNAVVYQKIVIETEPVPVSYLGPPQSAYIQ